MSKKKATKPDFSKETIRENLKINTQQILDSRGINANQFALSAGLDPQDVYRLTSKKTLPQVHIIAEVAHALGVSVDALVAIPKK